MNKINIKLAIRNILKERMVSLLNLFGLATGFAFALLMIVYTHREFSYDSFHTNSKKIYIPEFKFAESDGSLAIQRNLSIADIEEIRNKISALTQCTFLNYSYFDWDNGAWVEYQGEKYSVEKMAFADSNFPEVFSFPVKAGNLMVALDDPNSIVFTADNAEKIFGDDDPIGKSIKLNGHLFQVSAVLEKLPQNTSIWFGGLVNYKSSQKFLDHIINDYSYTPFFLLRNKEDREMVTQLVHDHILSALSKHGIDERIKSSFDTQLIPLQHMYFHDAVPYDPFRHGDKTLTWVVFFIGISILLLAITNFVNLTIAGSLRWAKGQTIQKVFGAGRNNGLKQLIIKAIIISFSAFIMSLLIVLAVLPFYNQLVNYPLELNNYFTVAFWAICFLIVLAIGFMSGLIPGSFLNKNASALQMKHTALYGTAGSKLWKSLLVFQFAISIALIAGSLGIAKQVRYILNRDLGFPTKNMVVLPVSKLGNEKNAFIAQLDSHHATQSHCLSTTYLDTYNEWGGMLRTNGKEVEISYHIIQANEDFIPTLNLQILEGRNFTEGNADEDSYIINEAAKQAYGITIEQSTLNGKPIVGMVKDFNIQSFRHTIEPVAICKTNKGGSLTVHFDGWNREEVAAYMTFLKSAWQSIGTGLPFEYEFLDQRLMLMYKKETNLMKAVTTFMGLSIFISSLGLLGLISFSTEIKMKEIGIRKVNGAKVWEVLTLLNKDFVKWVSIAFVVATPVAWYAMNQWLQNFAYKTELSWWIFALAGLVALATALFTVSWQSWKAATRNPVETLRYE